MTIDNCKNIDQLEWSNSCRNTISLTFNLSSQYQKREIIYLEDQTIETREKVIFFHRYFQFNPISSRLKKDSIYHLERFTDEKHASLVVHTQMTSMDSR